MVTSKSTTVFVLIAFEIIVIHGASLSSTLLEDYSLCGQQPSQLPLFLTPRNFQRGCQMLDVNFSFPYPVGRNVLVNIEIQRELIYNRTSWTTLVDFFVTQGYCVAIDRYMGEFAYNIERAVGIYPKMCPLPRGVYHASNLLVDYSTLRLPLMQSGRTRLIVKLHEKESKEMVSCQMLTLSNL